MCQHKPEPEFIMTTSPNTPTTDYESKRRVSFQPFVEVLDIPPVNPETKNLLWYTKSELVVISFNLQRQILIYKALSSLKKKRDALDLLADDSAACHAVKRQRLQGPLADATATVGPTRPMFPMQATLQTAI